MTTTQEEPALSNEIKSIAVTIKYGKGFEETWAVFRGLPHEIRADITAYFGMPDAETEGLTLHEIVLNATSIAHSTRMVANKLGAVAIPAAAPATPAPAPEQKATAADDPPFDVDPTPAPAPAPVADPGPAQDEDPVVYLIRQATSLEEIQKIWAANQKAFSQANVQEAVKAQRAKLGA